ncbi:MAG TPA: hypothetical protein VFX84_02325 [Candidatus Saccharimonadales bacterium]|nr:hypothetical protein [Candidatus Saccharimonadales bacterium]
MNRTTEGRLNIDNLEWLVHLARPFPVSAGRMQDLARKWGFERHVQDLLAQFPEDEEFDSSDDFLTRCEELEFLEGEEADMPEETLRSPQD